MTADSAPPAVIFLSGDVMTGRGIDQILPHPGDPALREDVVHDARSYVRLAERANGPIATPTEYAWPWGDALALFVEFSPDVRLINLETTITADGEFAPHKAVHYRMHPDNMGCLTAASPDVCAVANNHILDFGVQGLVDTLGALTRAEIDYVGAGRDKSQAESPAVLPLAHRGYALVAAGGTRSSGIPPGWAASDDRPGVAFLAELSKRTAADLAERVLAVKRPGDIAIVSIHWGSNWGYEVDSKQVEFAHLLIDMGIDLVHGHSSHHPRPIEVYGGKLIIYGCGDTVDDYEGIRTFDVFRNELRLLYFASVDRNTGNLAELRMVPMRMRNLRLEHVTADDAEWMRCTVERASRSFETRIERRSDGMLAVH